MTTQNQSFFPAALAAQCDKRGYKGDVAKFIYSFHKQDADPMDAISSAYAECLENPHVFNPLAIMGFCQDLMNQTCWMARRLYLANIQAEDPQSAPWGCDRAQRAKEAAGLDINNEELETIIADDFDTLYQMHSLMNSNSGTDSVLYFFSRSEKSDVDDSWSVVATCESFNQALEEMHTVTDKLQVESANTWRTKYQYLKQQAKVVAA